LPCVEETEIGRCSSQTNKHSTSVFCLSPESQNKVTTEGGGAYVALQPHLLSNAPNPQRSDFSIPYELEIIDAQIQPHPILSLYLITHPKRPFLLATGAAGGCRPLPLLLPINGIASFYFLVDWNRLQRDVSSAATAAARPRLSSVIEGREDGLYRRDSFAPRLPNRRGRFKGILSEMDNRSSDLSNEGRRNGRMSRRSGIGERGAREGRG
jgi:hypothetical protein